MFDKIKKKLYFEKYYLLFNKGLQDGRIVEFNDEFYSILKNTLVSGIPVSIHMKYLKPKIAPGRCYDRSLDMFFCFPNALLVRANDKALEYRFGKDSAGHGWMEIGEYVYDPSLLMRFDKDLYYKIFEPSDITKIDKDTYNQTTNGYYDEVTSITREDYLPGGAKRTELSVIVPLLKGIADLSPDENFKKEVDEYLESVQYDELQIQEEMNEKVRTMMSRR